MLSLPISEPSNPRASLDHYANNFLYVSSYCVTQTQLLQAIQKAKSESDTDWKISREKTVEQWVQQCEAGVKAGNMQLGMGLVVCRYIGDGLGGNYEGKAKEDAKALELPIEESFEDAVKRALKV